MPNKTKTPKRLTKGQEKMLTGVLSGVAEYFKVDPTLVRLGYLLLTVFTGFFPLVVVYFVAALVMPQPKA